MAKETGCQDKPWLAHYGRDIPETLEYEETHIVGFLEKSAERFPDKTALNFQGYKVSYHELNDMVSRFAACLNDFGIKKGDSVAVLLPNLIPCVVSYYAILKIGAIAVMNNPLYADRELHHQFNDSGSKALITLDLLANRMIDLRLKTNIK
ncbi:MAG: AMP-binding protein [Desulfobacterales bacterium]|nr:AMP-binding protein [Desulfobacterales bacterium]